VRTTLPTILLSVFYSFLLVSANSIKAANNKLYYSKLNIEAYEQFKRGMYLKSYEISISAKTDAIKSKSKIDLARSLSNIASVNLVLGNTEKALKIYLESYEISKDIGDTVGLDSTLNNLSGVFVRLNKFEEALEYLYLLPVLNNQERPPYQKVVANTAIINIFLETNQIDKAKSYIALTSKLFETYHDPFSKFYFIMTIYKLKIKKAKYREAITLINDVKSIALENEYRGLYVIALRNEIDLLITLKDVSKAYHLTEKAITIAERLELNSQLFRLYRIKKDLLIGQNNYKEALVYSEKTISLESKISSTKVKVLADIARIDRQVRETENKLIQSKKDQEILSLRLKQQSQSQIIWIIAIISIFILVFLFYYRHLSKKEINRQREVNNRLKELDRVKDRILKNTSHELRTPLNGIIGLSEVILENNNKDMKEETLDLIRLIKSSGVQLARVVNDILNMSKSQSNEITIINAKFDLVELIKDVIDICSPLANKKQISIHFKQIENKQEVFLDKTRLQQILFNIIGNAVKFTKKGKVDIKYTIENTGIKLNIADTGIGIPADKIDRITEGFEQVDSSDTRENSGSGLGLAISRNISQALGGNLEIASRINQGTTITISLPFAG